MPVADTFAAVFAKHGTVDVAFSYVARSVEFPRLPSGNIRSHRLLLIQLAPVKNLRFCSMGRTGQHHQRRSLWYCTCSSHRHRQVTLGPVISGEEESDFQLNRALQGNEIDAGKTKNNEIWTNGGVALGQVAAVRFLLSTLCCCRGPGGAGRFDFFDHTSRQEDVVGPRRWRLTSTTSTGSRPDRIDTLLSNLHL